MNLTLIQSKLHWHDPERNREMFDKRLAEIVQATDLIVLPEMFPTGFTEATEEMAEQMSGPTVEWMKEKAKQYDAAICGSLIIREEGHFYNRMIWIHPSGELSHYDKRHLFGMGGEGDQFTAGDERMIVEYKGLRFCLQVCYDLRFPVWSRNRCVEGKYDYDCILYVANWPSPRANAWQDLLKARAIENISYCIGVNRVGKDDKGLSYLGDSVALDFKGIDLARAGNQDETIQARISRDELVAFRSKFPVGLDADAFEIKT